MASPEQQQQHQQARASGNGNLIIQITGDYNAVNLQGHPYLTLVRAGTRVAHAKASTSDSPLSLLSPYRLDLIPLLARDADLASLEAWLTSAAGPAISVRTIAGGAGAGKTRFAAEALTCFCADPEARLGGFLTSDHLESFVRQAQLRTVAMAQTRAGRAGLRLRFGDPSQNVAPRAG